MLMKNFLTFTMSYNQEENSTIPNQLLQIQQAQQMHRNINLVQSSCKKVFQSVDMLTLTTDNAKTPLQVFPRK